jgi:hypothetical protein
MKKEALILAGTILGLIVVGMGSYAYLERTTAPVTPVVVPVTPEPAEAPYGITSIDATHFYIDGVHTIVGELPMPTPCDLLETEAIVRESSPEQVTFAFTVINTTEACAQVVTPARFSISASASDQANLAATFMGVPVTLNLKAAAPGETPDDFEVFIKG